MLPTTTEYCENAALTSFIGRCARCFVLKELVASFSTNVKYNSFLRPGLMPDLRFTHDAIPNEPISSCHNTPIQL
jgi:hypothetical protein